MLRIIIFLLAGTVLLSGCSGANATFVSNATSTPTKKVNIVSIGDSLTEGVGDSTKRGGYVPYLKEQLETVPTIKQVTTSNFGLKGHTSNQLLEDMKQPKEKDAIKKADIVIITIGGNDILHTFNKNFANLQVSNFTNEIKAYQIRLQQIINQIKEDNANASIFLVGVYNPFTSFLSNIPEINQIITDWNTASKEVITKTSHGQFIPIQDIFQSADKNLLYKEDQFHPNDQGYKLMAQRIYSYVKKLYQ